MPRPKGLPKTGGRKKGTRNRATADWRAAIALIAERNIAELEQWLDQVADENPARACDVLLKLVEYAVPKLRRTKHTGYGGKPLEAQIVYVHFPTQ
jgi:hypothetical protein